MIDFEEVIRDLDNPQQMHFEYDSGDNLHPNNADYEAMTKAVALDQCQK